MDAIFWHNGFCPLIIKKRFENILSFFTPHIATIILFDYILIIFDHFKFASGFVLLK